MAHGEGHVDLEAELRRAFPSPYCRTNWRAMVGTVAVTAVVVLGLSIEEHFRTGGSEWPPGVAAAPTPRPTISTSTTTGRTPAVQVAGALGAGLRGLTGARQADGNVRLVAGNAGRTAFNVAARTIRPSVVGIRATLPRLGAGPTGFERIGSGVVVGSGRHVVTCRHVIAGATTVVASRFGRPGERLGARVVAVENDLALLQIVDAVNMTPARFADSSQTRVGDWVLAVGHPFGLGLTVTAGIVGNRDGALNVPGGPRYAGLLQTDAPINEGSSGGPLVDLSGNVVGLNTAIYAPTGVFSGAGFAIPGNRVRAFLSRSLDPASAAGPRPMGPATTMAQPNPWPVVRRPVG